MEPTEHEAQEAGARGARCEGRDVPEPAAPKRKPKLETPAEAPAEEAPAAPEPPQLTREQQRALRMLERQSAYDRLTTGASVLV